MSDEESVSEVDDTMNLQVPSAQPSKFTASVAEQSVSSIQKPKERNE